MTNKKNDTVHKAATTAKITEPVNKPAEEKVSSSRTLLLLAGVSAIAIAGGLYYYKESTVVYKSVVSDELIPEKQGETPLLDSANVSQETSPKMTQHLESENPLKTKENTPSEMFPVEPETTPVEHKKTANGEVYDEDNLSPSDIDEQIRIVEEKSQQIAVIEAQVTELEKILNDVQLLTQEQSQTMANAPKQMEEMLAEFKLTEGIQKTDPATIDFKTDATRAAVLSTLIIDILDGYSKGAMSAERLATTRLIAQSAQAPQGILKAIQSLEAVSTNGVVTTAELLSETHTLKNDKRYTSNNLLAPAEADGRILTWVKQKMSGWVSVKKREDVSQTMSINQKLDAVEEALKQSDLKKALSILETALNDDATPASFTSDSKVATYKDKLIQATIQNEALLALKQTYQNHLSGGTL